MFKYYIIFPFHCFTQYYEYRKWYHKQGKIIGKCYIFLCALVRKKKNPAGDPLDWHWIVRQ